MQCMKLNIMQKLLVIREHDFLHEQDDAMISKTNSNAWKLCLNA